MTNSGVIRAILETTVSDLEHHKLFDAARIRASQSTDAQNQLIADLIRTNQFLLGELIVQIRVLNTFVKERLESLQTETDAVKTELVSIREHLSAQNVDFLAEQFKGINISNEIKTLTTALESSSLKEAIQPDFGWTRRNVPKISWSVTK